MPLYEINEQLEKITPTTFQEVNLKERSDIQRLLRSQIEVIDEDLLVISEEFSNWERAGHRIDLLCVDKSANLVVVELKRTEDGGYMELQALRYAAMVSTMTFKQAVEAFSIFMQKTDQSGEAEADLRNHLGWGDGDAEQPFASDVSIILVSADFSAPLTTTVLWLNNKGFDIRCVRLKPYSDQGRVLIDVQQIIPLPEAADYITKIQDKNSDEKRSRRGVEEAAKLHNEFWTQMIEKLVPEWPDFNDITPGKSVWLSDYIEGYDDLYYCFVHAKKGPWVELGIKAEEMDESIAIFDRLYKHKEKIEKELGAKLEWKKEKSFCRICFPLESNHAYRLKDKWPLTQDEMISKLNKLAKVLSPYYDEITTGIDE